MYNLDAFGDCHVVRELETLEAEGGPCVEGHVQGLCF